MAPSHQIPWTAARVTQQLLKNLKTTVDRTLEALISSGSSCALLDFPNNPNVGDSAIWLGERSWLKLRGVKVAHVAESSRSYSHDRLAAEVGDGLILLHGGGNLGDLWPRAQSFREAVITAFPHIRIIQLPQSIYFRHQANLERAQSVFNSHPDFVLLVRDYQSLGFARRHFKAQVELCPDMAFSLAPLGRRPSEATSSVLWLMRTDHESRGFTVPHQARIADWIDDFPPRRTRFPTNALVRSERLTGRLLRRGVPSYALLSRFQEAVFDRLASDRFARGVELLSGAEVLVTDRLHGHILALLLGIPHVVLDDKYGKVRSFFGTWTSGSPTAHWAEAPSVAQQLAIDLLARNRRSS